MVKMGLPLMPPSAVESGEPVAWTRLLSRLM